MTCPVVVIGGSAGALEPLLHLVQGLEAGFPAALVVVIHMPPDQPSALAGILERAGPLPAEQARDGLLTLPGRIYTAVPGHHLLLDGSRLKVSLGPRENHARPSIDVLFRSAARGGPGTAGVLLSGGLDDGVSGLWAIRRSGGRALVQHPEEAESPEMPLNAVRQVDVHEILRAAQLPAALTTWAWERRAQGTGDAGPGTTEPPSRQGWPNMNEDERRRLHTELQIAAGRDAPELLGQAPLSPMTCPECHGVMVQITEGATLRFRCHTGHAFTAGTLIAELRRAAEESLWSGLRTLREKQFLLEHLGQQFSTTGQAAEAAALRSELGRTARCAATLRETLLGDHTCVASPSDLDRENG
ncbi:hypothetical protein ASF71_07500 [Deinococcus sp. Leaf326]|nr:hypothetical protein ASF71_07500 [Deinococcus sp. Leaf326]